MAHHVGPADQDVGLKPLDGWDRGFEFLLGMGIRLLSLLCVAQLVASAHSPKRSLPVLSMCVCLTVCDLETSTVRRATPELGCFILGEKKRRYSLGGNCRRLERLAL
jgi:hypothetical protein